MDATKLLSIHLKYACNNYSFFVCSSLCRMKFYQVDFGWEYPSRVTLADLPTNNGFFLWIRPMGMVSKLSYHWKNKIWSPLKMIKKSTRLAFRVQLQKHHIPMFLLCTIHVIHFILKQWRICRSTFI